MDEGAVRGPGRPTKMIGILRNQFYCLPQCQRLSTADLESMTASHQPECLRKRVQGSALTVQALGTRVMSNVSSTKCHFTEAKQV